MKNFSNLTESNGSEKIVLEMISQLFTAQASSAYAERIFGHLVWFNLNFVITQELIKLEFNKDIWFKQKVFKFQL